VGIKAEFGLVVVSSRANQTLAADSKTRRDVSYQLTASSADSDRFITLALTKPIELSTGVNCGETSGNLLYVYYKH